MLLDILYIWSIICLRRILISRFEVQILVTVLLQSYLK